MKHKGLYSDLYRGQLEDDETWVEGYLSILSVPFNWVEVGHYISNKAGRPFAYKVRRNTVSLIED